MDKNEFIRWCLYYRSKGLSIIPVKNDKKPWIEWREYQTRLATEEEIRAWSKKYAKDLNIAIICGRVSDNLVVLDFESETIYSKFLEKLYETDSSLGWIIEHNTWIVRTGKGGKSIRKEDERGIHVYVRLLETRCLPRTRKEIVPGVDIKGEGGYVVAPPSRHPSGVNYEFIRGPPEIDTPLVVTCGQYETLIEAIRKAAEDLGLTRRREEKTETCYEKKCTKLIYIPEDKMRKIVDILRKFYIPEHRNNIVFSLLGWFVKRCVAYECAKWIVEKLAEETNDEEKNARLYLVDYHYYRRIDPRYQSHIPVYKLKGKSGLVEELTKVLVEYYNLEENTARNEALDAVRQIEQLAGIIYHRSLIMVPIKATSEGAYVWVINDPKRGLVIAKKKKKTEIDDECLRKCIEEEEERVTICRQKCRREKPVYDYEWLASWYIDKISIFYDTTSNLELFTLKIKYPGINVSRVLRYVTFDDIIDTLKSSGSMFRKMPDYLSMIIYGFIKRGLTIHKGRIVTGFLLDRKGRLVFIRRGRLAYLYNDIDKIGDEHGRQAILTLVELVEKWWNNDPRIWDIFAWAIIAPFGFVRKQVGLRNKLLVLSGEQKTGKSTLQNIIETMYNLDNEYGIKSASALGSAARIARDVMHTTFPIAIHEMRNLPLGSEVVTALKNIATDFVVHETASAHRTITRQYPAYALVSISCNFVPQITDPGLEERIFEVKFVAKDVKTRKQIEEFMRWLGENKDKLKLFGKWLARWAIEHWDEIKSIILQEDMINAGRCLLKKILNYFNIKIDITSEDNGEEEEMKERPTDVEYLIRLILDDYNRIRTQAKDCDMVDIAESIICAVGKGYMPSYYKHTYMRTSGETVDCLAITSMAIYEIADRYRFYVTSLQSLAEKIGAKVSVIRIAGRPVKAILIPIDKLKNMLSPSDSSLVK